MMDLFVKRAVATLVLAAQAVGMGAAAQAAGVHADAAAQAAPAGAVVQAAGTLHDSQPPVKPTPPTEPAKPVNVFFEDPVVVYILPLSREEFGKNYLCAMWDTSDPSLSEEERARLERENEATIAAHEARVDGEYQEYLAQHEAEYQQAKEQARAEAAQAAEEAAQARYQKDLAQYNADYAQYQKDLAQWEIAYAQWEKEQAEAKNKPDPTPAPTPGTDVTAPSVDNKTDEKTDEKADNKTDEKNENGLTEEQQRLYEALLRQISSRPISPGLPSTPGQRDQQQQKAESYLPDEQLKYKNIATEDEIARVEEYLAKYPDGTPWDNDTHCDLISSYPGFTGCAAYAFQAQCIATGTDHFVSSKNPSDIRKYSVVMTSSNIAVSHYIFVLSVDRVVVDSHGNIEYVEVTAAEGNYNSQVKIGRKVKLLYSSPAGPNLFLEVYNPA